MTQLRSEHLNSHLMEVGNSRVSRAKNRKTILFIGPIPPPITGQSLACQVFIDALRELHDVILIDINKSDFSSGGLVWSRVKEIWRILRQVRSEVSRADAVYFTITESLLGNVKDLLIYCACWRLLPRTVIHLHGGAGMVRLLHGPTGILRRLNTFFLNRLAAVIVLGSRLRAVYDKTAIDHKLHVVANFAEDVYQAPSDVVELKFAQIDPIRILYLSNMIEEKGYILLRDAVQDVELMRPGSVTLDFAGGFVTESDRTAFLSSIEPFAFITYHGIVKGDAKRELLWRSHILALPTYYPFEGQPICILEGYASGCAVLTTDHSGIFDVFCPGENGWAVDKNSRKSIRDALIDCLNERESIASVARHNANTAKDRFTADRYNTALLAIMDDVLMRPLAREKTAKIRN